MKANDIEMSSEYDFSQAKRGPIAPSLGKKTRITIRIDTDVLNWFREEVNKSGGGNYQRLINDALRAYVQNQRGEFVATLRKVIREELASAGVSRQ
jgi:uncharacterized protein (DUF4415 family)